MTYFWFEVVRRGGGMGARLDIWTFWTEMGGKEICFFARGGAGGRFRSDDDEILDRVSSFELLLLLLITRGGYSPWNWRLKNFGLCFTSPQNFPDGPAAEDKTEKIAAHWWYWVLTDVVIGTREFWGVGVRDVWITGADTVAAGNSSKPPPTTNVTDSRSRSSSLAEESSRSRRYLLTSVR